MSHQPTVEELRAATAALSALLERAPDDLTLEGAGLAPGPQKTLTAPDPLRQSTIARFDQCPLSVLLGHLTPVRQPSDLAALGTLFHRWVGWAIRHMRAYGQTQMPVDMGLAKLLEVVAQRDVPDDDVVYLPMREVKWLRVAVTKWCEGGPFNATRAIAIEERLYGTIMVPDGQGGFYERRITGKPDVIVTDPPDGIIVVDWKSGWAPPPKLGRENREARVRADVDQEEKLTDEGYAQQVIYGVLGLQNYPAINRVTLREAYVRHGEYRQSTIDRYNLERVTDVLGAVVAQLDAAFASGQESERWVPTAGPHCATCPAPRFCPLREWEGIPDNLVEAQLLAREWIVAAEVRKQRMPLLKGWVDAHGPIPLPAARGRREVGWPEWDGDKETAKSIHRGRGDFKMYEPDDSPMSPFDERLAELLKDRGA